MPRRTKGGDNDRVDLALTLLAVAVASLLVHGIASRLGALAPLLLLAAGAAASFVPVVPDVTLSPEVVLVGLLGFRDQLQMLAGYWRKTGDVKGLVLGMLRDDDMINLIPYGGDGALWLTVLALLGIVPAMRRHRNRWAVLAVVLVVIVFLGTVWTSTPVGLLASPWYKQRARILPVLEIPVLVLAMTVSAISWRLSGTLGGLQRAHGLHRPCRQARARPRCRFRL